MQIQRTDNSATSITFAILANEQDLTPIKNQVVARLSKNVKLPGFRSGKAPQALIEKNLDQNLLQSDFLDEAMTQLYAKATATEKVRPVTRPEVNVKKFVPFSDLEFEVTTTIIGKISLPDYKKIKVAKTEVKVTAKQVDEVLESLQIRMAEKVAVKRAAKAGDETVIDFKGMDDKGNPIDSAEGKDHPLLLGSKSFIPGFEDNLVGMKSGEEKTFPLTFPKNYSASGLSGKKVKFNVKLKTVNELKKSEPNDAFAKKVGPFKSIQELKADIKKQLTAEKERESLSDYQNAVLKVVSDKSTVEIPDALIEQQVTYNLDETRRLLVQRGQTYQEFLKAEGKTEEEYKTSVKPYAHEQLKASLVLAEIAEKDNVTISPEELNRHIGLLKNQYKDEAMRAELDKQENRKDIASRMLSEKVVNHLISSIN